MICPHCGEQTDCHVEWMESEQIWIAYDPVAKIKLVSSDYVNWHPYTEEIKESEREE